MSWVGYGPFKKDAIDSRRGFIRDSRAEKLRLLLAEPTTALTPRLISSKLKGVRGLGGAPGIVEILGRLKEISLVDFVDNHRAVRLRDENTSVRLLKIFCADSRSSKICGLHLNRFRVAACFSEVVRPVGRVPIVIMIFSS